jgi:hypothetical protein
MHAWHSHSIMGRHERNDGPRVRERARQACRPQGQQALRRCPRRYPGVQVITLTYILLSVAPLLACILACVALLPVLVSLSVYRAEMPVDATEGLDAWDTVLADLDERCSGVTVARRAKVRILTYTGPKRLMRRAYRAPQLAWRLPQSSALAGRPTSGCPPDTRRGVGELGRKTDRFVPLPPLGTW